MGSGGEAPEKFFMTTPSTLAITATNAPFHEPTRLGKDSYRQHIQSQVTLKTSFIEMYCITFLYLIAKRLSLE